MINHFKLKNNLEVIYTEKAGSKSVAISLRVIGGSMYESENEIGVAHFLEHIVFDGTKKYPTTQELSEFVDNKGAYRNGSTSKENINYVIKILKEEVESAFIYLGQIITEPIFNLSDIEKEKKVIEQEIQRLKSDPKLLSSRMIYSLIYPNSRMSVLNTGDIDDIQKIDQKVISSYFSKTHVSSNLIVSIVGDLPLSEVRTYCEKYLGNIPEGEKMHLVDIEVRAETNPKTILIPSLKQATLVVGYQGFPMKEKERFVLDLISTVLTRGKSSRLNSEIRERRGLAYNVFSENVSSRNHGIFQIAVGLSGKNVKDCLQIIQDELTKICNIPIPTQELNKAFTILKSNLSFSFEDPLHEASYYSNQWCCTGEVKDVEEIVAIYKDLTSKPEFIKETAAKVFGNKPSVLILTDK